MRSTRVVERLQGPVAPLPVCFNPDGSVHYEAVRKFVNWLCEQGVPVLLLTYGTSEYDYLTEDELWRLTAEIAEVNASRSLFVTATSYWKPTRCREFLQHADRVGADAVKVQVSPSFPNDRDSYVDYFERVSDSVDIPLLLLDPPASARDELARWPNIVGAKIHSMLDYYEYIRSTQDDEFAVISAGQMRTIVFGHQLGSPAYLCPLVYLYPGISLEFWNNIEARRYEEAWEMEFKYEEPWLKVFKEMYWLQVGKTAMHLRGLYPNDLLCPPQRPAAPANVERVRRAMEETFGPIERVAL